MVCRKRNLFRRLGTLIVSHAGYAYLMGLWTIALCWFCDIILVALDAPQGVRGEMVELVRGVLQAARGLLVTCDCITEGQTGGCCGSVCKAMGVVLIRDEGG